MTPQLIPLLMKRAPHMPLLIQENYTAKLGEMLKNGDVDVILLSEPFSEPGIVTQAAYDEPFRVVMPASHAWTKKPRIAAADLCNETLLLLSSGNCFRDQVLQTCACAKRVLNAGLQQSLEGSSLETIRQMVASGVGITVLPSTAAESRTADTKLTIAACRKHGKHVGIGGLASRPDLIAEYVKMGARYVSTGTDLAFLMSTCVQKAKQVQDLKIK